MLYNCLEWYKTTLYHARHPLQTEARVRRWNKI